MSVKSKMTRDHEQIKKWAEERGGKPATVKATAKGESAGILQIDFPGRGREDSLEEISWDEFFEKFADSNLVFLYQDKTASGRTSRFAKYVRGLQGRLDPARPLGRGYGRY